MLESVEKIVYNEKELAEKLGVKLYTVRQWRLQSSLPHFRTAGQIFYRLPSVMKWMDDQEHQEETVIKKIC